jgi:pantothenate kinase
MQVPSALLATFHCVLACAGLRAQVDMLVGDIYGGRDYTGIGLSANTIASSFGKVLHENKVRQGRAGCVVGGRVGQ